MEGIYLKSGSLNNIGVISGTHAGAEIYTGTLNNSGSIGGTLMGATLYSGYLLNTNLITAEQTGVTLKSRQFRQQGHHQRRHNRRGVGTVTATNSGLIEGGTIGVTLTGGVLYDTGTITGSQYAVDAQGSLALVISKGAAFNGKIVDQSGNGEMVLTGLGPGTLSGFGTSITGFNFIFMGNHYGTASWTLEGNIAGLASGQTN